MKVIVAALLVATASAIPLNSRLGASLIENARALKQNEVDTTWMVNYTVHFDKCHAVNNVYSMNGQQGNNNKNNNNNNQASQIFTQYMAEFSVCPSSSTCKAGCTGGANYIIDLGYFAQSYVEAKKEFDKSACETVKANCVYEDVSVCYAEAGLFCEQEQQGGNMNIQEFMQCQALENRNNQGNNNKDENGNYYDFTQYYLGPYCSSDGTSVKLGVFLDAGCSIFAEDNVYESLYGTSLPYSQSSIIQSDCLACDNGDYAANDYCKNTYGNALGRCETNLNNGATIDTTGCNYINSVLPAAEKASVTANNNPTKTDAFQYSTFGVTGFFALLSLVLSIYACVLYGRLKRSSKVALSDEVYNGADVKPNEVAHS